MDVRMKTVLIVDDEPALVRVVSAGDGDEALRAFRQHHPDLVILDLTLPTIDGLDVARSLRRDGDVPIIMLTARTDETDRVAGLELGADDYVTKPFSAREVVARVRAVVRRVHTARQPGRVCTRAQLLDPVLGVAVES